MIEVKGLTKFYGSLRAVNNLSFQVDPGEILGLVGPNGAGKTTTLKCLVGIIPPTKGNITICGEDLLTHPVESKHNVAFIPDEPRLFDYLTVIEHLQFIARIYGVDDFESQINPLLEEFELTDKKNVLPTKLSRGMKQKLIIACGLIYHPKVLIFDEPLTGLDPIAIRKTKDIILKQAKAGTSILISSHLLHIVEELCNRVLILKAGESVTCGTLQEIVRRIPLLSKDANLEEVFIHLADSPKENPNT